MAATNPIVCHDGLNTIMTCVFGQGATSSLDSAFTFKLITDALVPSDADLTSTHTHMLSTMYNGGDQGFLKASLSAGSADVSSVTEISFPQVTFTFNGTVSGTVKGIAVYGGAAIGTLSNLYFVQGLADFTPSSGDSYKYTLKVRIGNAATIT